MEYFENKIFKDTHLLSSKAYEFIECEFQGLDLSGSDFKNSKFLECKFKNCNGSNLKLLNSSLREVTFTDCKLIGIIWSECQSLRDIKFFSSQLNLGSFQDMDLSNFIFQNSQLEEVDFSQSKLIGSNFSKSNLRGAAFNGCDLTKADLRLATNYSIDIRYCKVSKAKFSAPEVLNLLKNLDIQID